MGGHAILPSMDNSQGTKRRWFRFRLSTVLILISIVAWGMATGPWMYTEEIHAHGSPSGMMQDSDYIMHIDKFNPYAMFPVAALAFFLALKIAGAMVDHRRHKSAAKE